MPRTNSEATTKQSHAKHVCVVVHFVNKGIHHLRLSKLFREKANIELLPEILHSEENLPKVATSLVSPIRNKVLNYKDIVTNLNLELDENNAIIDNFPHCECHLSEFRYPYHEHIVSGDLRMIKNIKLRKLLTKGPNYREPCFLNYAACLNSV